jgi:hypothetical protein
MTRLSSSVRWLLSILCTGFLLPVAAGLAKDWNKDHPGEAAGWMMATVGSFVHLPWVLPLTLVLVGVTTGVWLDWLLRKFDGSRSAERRSLGYDFLSIASDLKDDYDSGWDYAVYRTRPALISSSVRAAKFRLWFPPEAIYSNKADAGYIVNYLQVVGRLLLDEHFGEARGAASQLKTTLEEHGVLQVQDG